MHACTVLYMYVDACINLCVSFSHRRILLKPCLRCCVVSAQFGRQDYTILRPFKEIQLLIDSLSACHGGTYTLPLPRDAIWLCCGVDIAC